MRDLLDRRPALDALFAANDLTAAGALRVLRERGLRVPEDVAVVGFDDMLPVAEQTDPPLTTVRQDIEEMGRLMARLLLRRLDRPGTGQGATDVDGPGGTTAAPDDPDDAGAGVVLPTTLVRRASA